MPTSTLPDDLCKVSYIVPKRHKAKLEAAARKAGVSMSTIISQALSQAGVLPAGKVA